MPAQAGPGGIVKPDAKALLHDAQAREELLSRPLYSLNWPVIYHPFAEKCVLQLERQGILTVQDLLNLGEDGLQAIPYARSEAFKAALNKELASMGLSLGMLSEAKQRAKTVWNLSRDIWSLGLSTRALHALEKFNVVFVFQLVQRKESELLEVYQVGPVSVNEIKGLLSKNGLSMGMKLDDGLLAEVEREIRGSDREGTLRALSMSTKACLTYDLYDPLVRLGITYMYQVVGETSDELPLKIGLHAPRFFPDLHGKLASMGLWMGMKLDDETLEEVRRLTGEKKEPIPSPRVQSPAPQSSPQAPSLAPKEGQPQAQAPIYVVFLKPVYSILKQAEQADLELKGLIGVVSGEAMLNLVRMVNSLKGLSSRTDAGNTQLGIASVTESGKALIKACPEVKPAGEILGFLGKARKELGLLGQYLKPEAIEKTRNLVEMFQQVEK